MQLSDGRYILFAETCEQRVAEELGYSYRIELYAVFERGVTNLAVVVAIDLGVGSAKTLQFTQLFAPVPHLLHRIRRKQVVVYLVQFDRVFSKVAFGPFLRIAYRTYRPEVSPGHKIRLRTVLYQIRERHIARVGMVGMASHNEVECSNFARPEQIGVGCRFGSAFGYTLVDGTEFVHVVRLVAARPCIEE